MKAYQRDYPLFSLCGLNCGLCPRFHTKGTSKCPGCGGKDFMQKHPACSVINCGTKHGDIEYCFQCESYPCQKYLTPNTADSFITYKNVNTDLDKAKLDIDKYREELNEKVEILTKLTLNFNDGRRKNFYCIAVNLLSITVLRQIMKSIMEKTAVGENDAKAMTDLVVSLINEAAQGENVMLTLRK